MNKYLKDALIFVGGLGTGVLASYIFIKRKFEIISEEEIESVRNLYAERFPEEFSNGAGHKKDETDIPDEYYVTNTDISSQERTRQKGPRKTIDYTSYYNAGNDIAESEHPEDDEYDRNYVDGERETERRSKAKDPKIIKAGDFGSEAGYDEQTLLYYTVNRVLATEEDEILAENDFSEVEDILGNALTKYGFDTSDEEKLYVRNEKRGCDYQIIKVRDKFDP